MMGCYLKLFDEHKQIDFVHEPWDFGESEEELFRGRQIMCRPWISLKSFCLILLGSHLQSRLVFNSTVDLKETAYVRQFRRAFCGHYQKKIAFLCKGEAFELRLCLSYKLLENDTDVGTSFRNLKCSFLCNFQVNNPQERGFPILCCSTCNNY